MAKMTKQRIGRQNPVKKSSGNTKICAPLFRACSAKSNALRVLSDQLQRVDDLALALLRITEREKTGIFHVSGSEYLSRLEFAFKLADIFELDSSLIKPIKTSELHQAAERPMNSGFLLLKAETELGIKPLNATEGLYFLKSQLGSEVIP